MNFGLDIDKINYIKILYKDENDFSRCIKASVKNLTEYDIYACVKKEEWEKIPAPQNVTVNFACNDGLYKAHTILKYTKYEEPYLYFALKLPEAVEYQQNREFFRVNISKNTVISYSIEDSIKKICGKSINISANGIGIILERKEDFPKEVTLDIYFETRAIRTKAKFIRIDEEDDIIKASFKFIDIAESDVDFISRICIKKQIEEKRSTLQ